jgi:DNA-binding NtrC family response regulator
VAGKEGEAGGETVTFHGAASSIGQGSVRRFRITLVDGPAKGLSFQSTTDRCSIGSSEGNDLVVADPTVSRFHAEVVIEGGNVRVRDLGSRNGTMVDGVRLVDGFLRSGSLVHLGQTVAQFEFGSAYNRLPITDETRFGSLAGVSAAMRQVFAILTRAAAREVTVLLEGETGTGKSKAARSIHDHSPRAEGPFVVVDCGAVHNNLLESQLFGHERGAFTGALQKRVGAFEEARGGTIFLDEIGELPIDLQPKLLGALESREIRRVGGAAPIGVDARVIAATNRDLRAEVNAGRFRSDLYFRLAVVRVTLPPLRQRPEDIPIALDEMLRSLGATPEEAEELRAPESIARLQRAAWPGNVRELRNWVERFLILREAPPSSASASGHEAFAVDPSMPYAAARDRLLTAFERRYFDALLRTHGGKVARAAEAAGLDRRYLYRILQRHGLGPERE